MGDLETKTVFKAQAPTLQEAVKKVVRSFDTSPLDGKFNLTIRQGFDMQRALNKVWKALEDLEKAAGNIPTGWERA